MTLLASCNGEDEPSTTLDPLVDAPSPERNDDDDGLGPVSLEAAVRSTLDAGNAAYTIRLVEGAPQRIDGDTDVSVVERSAAPPGEASNEIEGRVEFRQRLRSLTLDGDGGRTVVVDDRSIYMVVDEADWGRIDLGPEDSADVRGGAGAMSLDLLIALHDPGSVLEAVVPAQTGTVRDDAGTSPQPDVDGRRITVLVRADQVQDPLTEMMIRRLGLDELEVHVWMDEPGGDDAGEGGARVRSLAYPLPARTTPAAGRHFVVVELDDLGAVTEIERPASDHVSEIDPSELADATDLMKRLDAGAVEVGVVDAVARIAPGEFADLGYPIAGGFSCRADAAREWRWVEVTCTGVTEGGGQVELMGTITEIPHDIEGAGRLDGQFTGLVNGVPVIRTEQLGP